MKVRDLVDKLNEVLSEDINAEVDVVGYYTIKAGDHYIEVADA